MYEADEDDMVIGETRQISKQGSPDNKRKIEVRYELKVNTIVDDITKYRLNWKKRRISKFMRKMMTLEYLAQFECEI
jgi:hypothetical protein